MQSTEKKGQILTGIFHLYEGHPEAWTQSRPVLLLRGTRAFAHEQWWRLVSQAEASG